MASIVKCMKIEQVVDLTTKLEILKCIDSHETHQAPIFSQTTFIFHTSQIAEQILLFSQTDRQFS